MVTRYEPDAERAYEAFEQVLIDRHARHAVLARRQHGRRAGRGASAGEARFEAIAPRGDVPCSRSRRESCTGGLLAARLTEPAGASEYVKGGIVAYSNEVKISQAGVPQELIDGHGAVSAEVAQALADGARARLGADVGVGVTGVAGPGGGSEEKPVGLVWLSVAGAEGERAHALGEPPGRALGRARSRDHGGDAPDPPRPVGGRRARRPSIAGEMSRGAKARLFVALDLPAAVRERLALWARETIAGLSARG